MTHLIMPKLYPVKDTKIPVIFNEISLKFKIVKDHKRLGFRYESNFMTHLTGIS